MIYLGGRVIDVHVGAQTITVRLPRQLTLAQAQTRVRALMDDTLAHLHAGDLLNADGRWYHPSQPAPRGAPLPVFSGLDGFPETAASTAPLPPETRSRHAVEDRLHEPAEMRDARGLLRATAQHLTPVIFYFRRARAWYVYAPQVTTPAQAAAFGKKLYQGLIGLRNLPANEPGLHQCPLYVGYGAGAIELAPPSK